MSYFEDFEEGRIGSVEDDDYIYELEARKFDSFKRWKTRDGRILNINDMETSHIKNCMKMLERKNKSNCYTYKYMKATIMKREKKKK